MGCLSTSPLPLKSNTRSYVSSCLLSQQTGPEVSPALWASGKALSPRGSNSPALPRRGLERWGRGDLKVKGWKKATREGVKINANRKEIHRRIRSNPVGASRTGDESRFFGTKTKKKIRKKKKNGKYISSPANPCSAHFFLMEFQCRGACACVCLSLLPPSPLPRSRSLLSISALPRLPLPPYSLSPCSSLRPLPPPSRLPRQGSHASPHSSARGSALRLPGGWRRGARERGGATTLCSSRGGGSAVGAATRRWRWRQRTLV